MKILRKTKLFLLMLMLSISLIGCETESKESKEETKKEQSAEKPSPKPLEKTTQTPTDKPIQEPTVAPTLEPTVGPTVEPTVTLPEDPTKESVDELEIHFIECGNGDSIYVECGKSTLLIDAGDESGEVTSYLDEELEDELDYIILTHPHADHLADMSEVVSGYTDKDTKIIVSPATNNTKIFEDFLDSVGDTGLKLTKAEVGTEYELGDADFTIVGPVSEEYSDLNDYSVGIYLEYEDFTFLSMGDAEGKAEQEMLDTGIIEDVTLYKASHHGSWVDETNSTVFNKISPDYLVIPCSVREENTYGHPHIEIIDYAIKNSVLTYLTGYQGDIVFKISSDKVNINEMPYDKMSELLVKTTPEPTVKPTIAPTVEPTIKPTVEPTKAPTKAPVVTKTPTKKPTVTKAPVITKAPTKKPVVTKKPTAVPVVKVWISETGSKYHSKNNCGRMNPNKAYQMTLEAAENSGYTRCSKCY